MFVLFYKDIIDIEIDRLLNNNTKVTSTNLKSVIHQAFFYVTNQQSTQTISKNRFKITQDRSNDPLKTFI